MCSAWNCYTPFRGLSGFFFYSYFLMLKRSYYLPTLFIFLAAEYKAEFNAQVKYDDVSILIKPLPLYYNFVIISQPLTSDCL